MRNKKWDLIFVFIGLLSIIFSFRGDNTIEVVFGLELNIWIYRAIWAFITIGSFYSYRKKVKSEVDNNE